MILSNNGGDIVPTGRFLSPNETFNTRYVLQPMPKRSHRNPQTTQAIATAIDCSLQTNSKALLLKTKSTQFIEHEELRLVLT